jgi:hypothetical protein
MMIQSSTERHEKTTSNMYKARRPIKETFKNVFLASL